MKKEQLAKLALMGLAAMLTTGNAEANAVNDEKETQGVYLAGGCGEKCSSQSARSRRYNIAMEEQTNVPSNVQDQNTLNYGLQPQDKTPNKAPSQVNPQATPDYSTNNGSNQNWNNRRPTADASPVINSNLNTTPSHDSWNYGQNVQPQQNIPRNAQQNSNLIYGNGTNGNGTNNANKAAPSANPNGNNGQQTYWIEEDVIDVQPNSNAPKAPKNTNSTWNTNGQKTSQSYNYGK